MNSLKLENFLVNLSFFLLFASMLYYWIQLVFFSNIFKENETVSIPINTKDNYNDVSTKSFRSFQLEGTERNPLTKEEYLVTKNFDKQKQVEQNVKHQTLLYPSFFPQNDNLNEKKEQTIHYGQFIVFLANLTMLFLLLDRWLDSGHFPLSNLYESLIFLSWSLTSITLWVEKIQSSSLLNFNLSFNISNLLFTGNTFSWITKLKIWFEQKTKLFGLAYGFGYGFDRVKPITKDRVKPITNDRVKPIYAQQKQSQESFDPKNNMDLKDFKNRLLNQRRNRTPFRSFQLEGSDFSPKNQTEVASKINNSDYSEIIFEEPFCMVSTKPKKNKFSCLGYEQQSEKIDSLNAKKKTVAESVLYIRRKQEVNDYDSTNSATIKTVAIIGQRPTQDSHIIQARDTSGFGSKIQKESEAQFLNSQIEMSGDYKKHFLTTDSKGSNKWSNPIKTGNGDKSNYIFGAIITPIALLIHAFASFSLPPELRESTSLVPALQSNWLIMHVTVIMLSYAALLAGCLFSFVFLLFDIFFSFKETSINMKDYKDGLLGYVMQPPKFQSQILKSNDISYDFFDSSVDCIDYNANAKPTQLQSPKMEFFVVNGFVRTLEKPKKIQIKANEGMDNISNRDLKSTLTVGHLSDHPINRILEINQQQDSMIYIKNLLDDLSYKTIGIGFLLLTIGIFSGAVWANEAWGSYWSWDPKETWALITWFIFAIYLHARLQLNWPKKKAAIIACAGFIVVWICYLGVNLLGQGLHSYGFLKL